MISHKQSAETIDHSAAQWAARLDAGPLSPAERAGLQAWIDSDSRCMGALARAQAVLIGPGVADGWPLAPAVPRRAWPDRRWVLGGGSLAAASVAAMLLRRSDPPPLHVRSERGEVRRLPLPDGSRLTLNTETALDVEFSGGLRRVRLLQGEAFFEVAKDAARPFVVIGPEAQVRTVGTSYSVRLADKTMRVLVASGRVAIEATGQGERALGLLRRFWATGEAKPVFVEAEEEAKVSQGPYERLQVAVRPLPKDVAMRALLWREGKLFFEGVTLAAAAAEFARYSYRHIVIRNPSLAAARVSGLFAANDPEGFAKAVAVSLDAHVAIAGQAITLEK